MKIHGLGWWVTRAAVAAFAVLLAAAAQPPASIVRIILQLRWRTMESRFLRSTAASALAGLLNPGHRLRIEWCCRATLISRAGLGVFVNR